MGAVGLRRADTYVTNVIPHRIASADKLAYGEAEPHMRALHERLAALYDPVVIVPMGNLALYALTGKGKVAWHARDGRSVRPGITSWRGSILEYEGLNGRRTKVIPTIHPAATFARGEGKDEGDVGMRRRSAQYHRACVADWRRIAGDLAFRELRLPERQLTIVSDFVTLAEIAKAWRRTDTPLAFDIETPRVRSVQQVGVYKTGKRKGQPKMKVSYAFADVACVGFAASADAAFTVPLTTEHWNGEAGRFQAVAKVREILEGPAPKIAQNGGFDCYWLAHRLGIRVANWRYDTRAMHHALDPCALHDLAYLASIYTREPYWKDECKDPDELMRFVTSDEALYSYCARDAAVTFEVWQALRAELEAAGRLPSYNKLYGALHEPLMRLSLHGIAVDVSRQQAERERVAAEAADAAVIIKGLDSTLVGKGGGVSVKALSRYLYETLRLPKQYEGRGSGRRLSTGEVALKRLAAHSGAAKAVCEAVLRLRGLAKQGERFDAGRVAPDGRMRSLFSPYTDTGRLTSQEPPAGEGGPMQNMPRGSMRSMFVPDA
jgi:uracil-DNA glycosylase family 4